MRTFSKFFGGVVKTAFCVPKGKIRENDFFSKFLELTRQNWQITGLHTEELFFLSFYDVTTESNKGDAEDHKIYGPLSINYPRSRFFDEKEMTRF